MSSYLLLYNTCKVTTAFTKLILQDPSRLRRDLPLFCQKAVSFTLEAEIDNLTHQDLRYAKKYKDTLCNGVTLQPLKRTREPLIDKHIDFFANARPARLIRQWPQKENYFVFCQLSWVMDVAISQLEVSTLQKGCKIHERTSFTSILDHQSSPLVFSKECQIWTDAFFCLALFFLSLRHENWRVHRAQNTGNIIKPGGTRRAPVSCQTSISALFSRGLSGMQKIVNYRGSIVHWTRQKLWVAVRSAKHGTKNSEASSFVKKGGHDKKMILGAWIMHVDLSSVLLSSGFTSHLFLLVYYWIFSVRRK